MTKKFMYLVSSTTYCCLFLVLLFHDTIWFKTPSGCLFKWGSHDSLSCFREKSLRPWSGGVGSSHFLSPFPISVGSRREVNRDGFPRKHLGSWIGLPCPCPAPNSTHVTLTSPISSRCGSKTISGSKIKTLKIKSKDNPDAGSHWAFRGPQSITYLKPCTCILDASSTSRWTKSFSILMGYNREKGLIPWLLEEPCPTGSSLPAPGLSPACAPPDPTSCRMPRTTHPYSLSPRSPSLPSSQPSFPKISPSPKPYSRLQPPATAVPHRWPEPPVTRHSPAPLEEDLPHLQLALPPNPASELLHTCIQPFI